MEGWFIYTPVGKDKFTMCGNNKIFGGFGIFGTTTSVVKMIALAPHYFVRVIFKMYKIDSWENESFYLYLDGVQMFS